MCILVQFAAEAARAERRAQRKAVKKQLLLRFDDVMCFGGFERGFERRSHPWTWMRPAASSREARTPCPYGEAGSRVRPQPSILRHRRRDRSRGIARRIRYTEQLWAGAAGAGGASTTYLPARSAVAPAATLAQGCGPVRGCPSHLFLKKDFNRLKKI